MAVAHEGGAGDGRRRVDESTARVAGLLATGKELLEEARATIDQLDAALAVAPQDGGGEAPPA